MYSAAIVFLGAGIGGVIRHSVNVLITRMVGFDFPWGIAIINIVGSFLMGALTAWLAFRSSEGWTQQARLFAATGILGGFTTFSAFSLDFALLWERGQISLAAAYVIGSVGLSLLAIFAGIALVRAIS